MSPSISISTHPEHHERTSGTATPNAPESPDPAATPPHPSDPSSPVVVLTPTDAANATAAAAAAATAGSTHAANNNYTGGDPFANPMGNDRKDDEEDNHEGRGSYSGDSDGRENVGGDDVQITSGTHAHHRPPISYPVAAVRDAVEAAAEKAATPCRGLPSSVAGAPVVKPRVPTSKQLTIFQPTDARGRRRNALEICPGVGDIDQQRAEEELGQLHGARKAPVSSAGSRFASHSIINDDDINAVAGTTAAAVAANAAAHAAQSFSLSTLASPMSSTVHPRRQCQQSRSIANLLPTSQIATRTRVSRVGTPPHPGTNYEGVPRNICYSSQPSQRYSRTVDGQSRTGVANDRNLGRQRHGRDRYIESSGDRHFRNNQQSRSGASRPTRPYLSRTEGDGRIGGQLYVNDPRVENGGSVGSDGGDHMTGPKIPFFRHVHVPRLKREKNMGEPGDKSIRCTPASVSSSHFPPSPALTHANPVALTARHEEPVLSRPRGPCVQYDGSAMQIGKLEADGGGSAGTSQVRGSFMPCTGDFPNVSFNSFQICRDEPDRMETDQGRRCDTMQFERNPHRSISGTADGHVEVKRNLVDADRYPYVTQYERDGGDSRKHGGLRGFGGNAKEHGSGIGEHDECRREIEVDGGNGVGVSVLDDLRDDSNFDKPPLPSSESKKENVASKMRLEKRDVLSMSGGSSENVAMFGSGDAKVALSVGTSAMTYAQNFGLQAVDDVVMDSRPHCPPRKKQKGGEPWMAVRVDSGKCKEMLKQAMSEHPNHLVFSFLGLQNSDLRSIFETDIPLTSLRFTRLVDLDHNKLNALTSHMCRRFQEYRVDRLNLAYNQLHEIKDYISICQCLRTLDVSRNELTKVPDSLSKLECLEVLDFSHNRLERLPSGLDKLRNLEILSLSQNLLKYLPNDLVGESSKLFALDLSRNRSLGELPACLKACKRLRNLELEDTVLWSLLTRKEQGASALLLVKNVAGRTRNDLHQRANELQKAKDITTIPTVTSGDAQEVVTVVGDG